MTERSNRRRRSALLAVVGLVAAVAGVVLDAGPVQASPALRIAIPAYNWSSGTWSRVAATTEADIVVANPASGPGGALDTVYAALIATATAAGKRVVGYVHTDYARRPVADVVGDINRYRAWYGLNGFFLDEVPWSCDDAKLSAYYASVAATIRDKASPFVVLNPGGTQQRDCYMASADVVVNFEGTAAAYGSWQANAWTAGYAPSRFWHIVYSAGDAARDVAVLAARSRNVGALYVTPQSPPNPFVDLPSVGYWSALRQVVSGGHPVTGVTTTTTTTTTTTITTTTTTTTTTPATLPGATAARAVAATVAVRPSTLTVPTSVTGATGVAPSAASGPGSAEFGGGASGVVPRLEVVGRSANGAPASVARPDAPVVTYSIPPITRPRGRVTVRTTTRKPARPRVSTTTKPKRVSRVTTPTR